MVFHLLKINWLPQTTVSTMLRSQFVITSLQESAKTYGEPTVDLEIWSLRSSENGFSFSVILEKGGHGEPGWLN